MNAGAYIIEISTSSTLYNLEIVYAKVYNIIKE
jgi:hypothetical protein